MKLTEVKQPLTQAQINKKMYDAQQERIRNAQNAVGPLENITTIGQYIERWYPAYNGNNPAIDPFYEDLTFENVGGDHVVSWEGCPTHFGDEASFNIHGTALTSIEGLHLESANWVQLTTRRGIASYAGIHKKIKHCTRLFITPGTNLLGTILINGIEKIQVINFGNSADTDATVKMTDILTRYCLNKDINACQEELIDAGFTKQARL